jgi:hypothetical protein
MRTVLANRVYPCLILSFVYPISLQKHEHDTKGLRDIPVLRYFLAAASMNKLIRPFITRRCPFRMLPVGPPGRSSRYIHGSMAMANTISVVDACLQISRGTTAIVLHEDVRDPASVHEDAREDTAPGTAE